MKEYQVIDAYFGDRRVKQSGVLLIHHIDEGLIVLDEIGASDAARRAFCIHPLFQDDTALTLNVNYASQFDPRVVLLAMEFRRVVNGYTSRHQSRPPQEIDLSPLVDVNDMLIADKVQSYKDFLLHRLGRDPRSARLDQYYRQWLERLGVSREQFQQLGALLKDVTPLLEKDRYSSSGEDDARSNERST